MGRHRAFVRAAPSICDGRRRCYWRFDGTRCNGWLIDCIYAHAGRGVVVGLRSQRTRAIARRLAADVKGGPLLVLADRRQRRTGRRRFGRRHRRRRRRTVYR